MGLAERAAAEVLEELGLRKPPVDVRAIAERLGARVRAVPHDGSISGMLYRDGRQVIIGVNERDVPARQRFTIAHELGHLKLHRGRRMILDHKVQDEIRVDLRDTTQPSSHEEVQANAFAAELLMPQALVVEATIKAPKSARRSEDMLVSHLMRAFDVSRDAMVYRLINLGFIAPSR
jgi:Zn-dependent peptidase ImmA (M78 family)